MGGEILVETEVELVKDLRLSTAVGGVEIRLHAPCEVLDERDVEVEVHTRTVVLQRVLASLYAITACEISAVAIAIVVGERTDVKGSNDLLFKQIEVGAHTKRHVED